MEKVAVVDVDSFLKNDRSCQDLCKEVVRSFHETGILIIKDPRVVPDDNEKFLSLMEKYYDQPDEIKMADSRPELHFQVGSTPEGTEYPRDSSKYISTLNKDQLPHIPKGHDHKWRFFWRVGDRPKETKFKELNAEKVIPQAFENWETDMDNWAKKMLDSITTVCEMFSLGLTWPKDSLTKMMHLAPQYEFIYQISCHLQLLTR